MSKSFYAFLKTYTDRDDPVGDFARDARRDNQFPRQTTSWSRIEGYLTMRGACREAKAAGREAFDLFTNCPDRPRSEGGRAAPREVLSPAAKAVASDVLAHLARSFSPIGGGLWSDGRVSLSRDDLVQRLGFTDTVDLEEDGEPGPIAATVASFLRWLEGSPALSAGLAHLLNKPAHTTGTM